jgi:hypothetical protein
LESWPPCVSTSRIKKPFFQQRIQYLLVSLKKYWLKREVRSNASWERFLTTYDTTRSFSVDLRSKGVDLPLSIKGNARRKAKIRILCGSIELFMGNTLVHR